MKLASLKGGRDGRLAVVSHDLSRYLPAGDVADTLQEALDDWDRCEPKLEAIAEKLADKKAGETFDPAECASPLPRAYQWADGSAYVNHVELVRKARGAEMPESFWTDPLMYQGGSDSFIGPYDPILAASEDWGIDFEAEIAVVTDREAPEYERESRIEIRRAKNGRLERTIRGANIRSMRWAPTGNRISYNDGEGNLVLLDLETGEAEKILNEFTDPVLHRGGLGRVFRGPCLEGAMDHQRGVAEVTPFQIPLGQLLEHAVGEGRRPRAAAGEGEGEEDLAGSIGGGHRRLGQCGRRVPGFDRLVRRRW